MPEPRPNLLTTALVGALLPKDVPEGRMLRAWLDSWSGIGHVGTGLARPGYARDTLRRKSD